MTRESLIISIKTKKFSRKYIIRYYVEKTMTWKRNIKYAVINAIVALGTGPLMGYLISFLSIRNDWLLLLVGIGGVVLYLLATALVFFFFTKSDAHLVWRNAFIVLITSFWILIALSQLGASVIRIFQLGFLGSLEWQDAVISLIFSVLPMSIGVMVGKRFEESTHE